MQAFSSILLLKDVFNDLHPTSGNDKMKQTFVASVSSFGIDGTFSMGDVVQTACDMKSKTLKFCCISSKTNERVCLKQCAKKNNQKSHQCIPFIDG